MRILILLLLTCPFLSLSQSALVPYLVGGKYGMANEKGTLIMEPQFDGATIGKDHPLILVKKNGLWGLMNDKGKMIIPCKMKEAPALNQYTKPAIPYLQWMMKSSFVLEDRKYRKAQLYQVTDAGSKVQYYVNPFVVPDTLIPFLDSKYEWEDKNRILAADPISCGFVKVLTLDRKINFVDTSGKLVLKESIRDGDMVSEHIYGIQNESKKIALFHIVRGAISDYVYDQVSNSVGDQFIYAQREKVRETHYPLYDLYNADGKLLVKDNPQEYHAIGSLALINSGVSGEIMDDKGQVLVNLPDVHLYYEYPHKNMFYFTINSKRGLIDAHGKVLLEPVYNELSINKDTTIFYGLQNKAGHLNHKLEEILVVDSVSQLSYLYGHGGYYQTKRTVKYVSFYGVIDRAGNEILPPVYSRIKYYPEDQLLEVTKDSMTGFFDVRGNVILPLTRDKVTVREGKGQLSIYAREGPMIYTIATKKYNPDPGIPPLRVKETNDKAQIVNFYQQPVPTPPYQKLKAVSASEYAQPLFLAQNPSLGKWYDVLNKNGKMILPEGYGVHEKVYNYSFTISGLTVVTHKGDVNAITDFYNNPRYRSGVIDHEGNWVIEPDYLMIESFGRKFISVMDLDDKKHSYYTHDGKLIVTNAYWKVPGLQPGDMDHGMLLVTQPENKETHAAYLKELEGAGTEQQLKNILDTKPLPTMLQGAVNLEGKLIIPIEYTYIDPFQYTYTTAQKRDKQGKPYSVILGMNGQTLLQTKYAELKFVGLDSLLLMFRKSETDSLYGLMDLAGNILLEPGFTNMDRTCDRKAFALTYPDGIYLVMKDNYKTKTLIGQKSEDGTNCNLLLDGFFTGVGTKETKTFQFFTTKGEPLKSCIGFSAATYLYDKTLPPGIVAVRKTSTSLPHFFNYVTGVEFVAR